MTYTEEVLNKIAYADGEKTINESGLTLSDGGKTYRFRLESVAKALNTKPDVQSIAYKMVGFKAKNNYESKPF